MGCAPTPRNNDQIPAVNAKPDGKVKAKEVTSIYNLITSESRLTRARFQDVANLDIHIKEERRVSTDLRCMDFLNKVEIMN